MKGIGEALRRTEDDRLVRGTGRFADDLRLDKAAYAVFARSPHAHARIVTLDVSDARALPGVLAVLTGEDIAAAGVGPIPHSIGSSKAGADVPLANADGSERARRPIMRCRSTGCASSERPLQRSSPRASTPPGMRSTSSRGVGRARRRHQRGAGQRARRAAAVGPRAGQHRARSRHRRSGAPRLPPSPGLPTGSPSGAMSSASRGCTWSREALRPTMMQ